MQAKLTATMLDKVNKDQDQGFERRRMTCFVPGSFKQPGRRDKKLDSKLAQVSDDDDAVSGMGGSTVTGCGDAGDCATGPKRVRAEDNDEVCVPVLQFSNISKLFFLDV